MENPHHYFSDDIGGNDYSNDVLDDNLYQVEPQFVVYILDVYVTSSFSRIPRVRGI